MKLKPRDYQIAAIEDVRNELRGGKDAVIICGATGCHAKGQEILMHDGSLKAVEDVAVGDCVMGWDSTPRRVLELHRGADEMMKIIPTKGTPFVVNRGHILSLYKTNDGRHGAGCVIDMSVRDYESSNKTFKHTHKLIRRGVGLFGGSRDIQKIDPYFLGVLLGDGSIIRGVGVSKPDKEIRDEVYWQAKLWGLRVRISDESTSATLHMSRTDTSSPNPLSATLAEMGLFGKGSADKFVPFEYKTGSAESRAAVIAGLLDTDGHKHSGGYDFISKSERLSNDLAYLCRSVGLAAYVAKCEKSCQNNFTGTYWRVGVSGDCSKIPCRIPRKIAESRSQKKNHLVTGFKVESVGDGNYYGFTIEGDGRYLMGDFTVTHNSGKTVLAAHIIENAVARSRRILFLYRGTELGTQCSEKLDALGIRHGIIQAGSKRRNAHQVQVASAETLVRMVRKAGATFAPWIPEADLLIIDEAHEAITPTILEIVDYYKAQNPALTLIGLSATPQRTDGKGLGKEAGGLFDSIVLAGTTRFLIDEGYLCEFDIYDTPMKLDFSGVKLKGGEFDDGEVMQVIDKPKVIGSVYENWKTHADGKKTLVFAMNRIHGQHICEEFKAHGERFVYIDGLTPKEERDKLVKEFKAARGKPGELVGIVSVALFLRGFDVVDLECVSMARPTMSLILYLQSFGRGLRIAPWLPNKRLIYLDHGNNVSRHGFPDEEREWSLEGKKRGAAKERPGSVTTCPECYAMHPSGTAVCDAVLPYGDRMGQVCGYEFGRAGPQVPVTAENVVLTKKEREAVRKAEAQLVVDAEVAELRHLVEVQRERGYKWAYAVVKFNDKFGHRPGKKHGAKVNWVADRDSPSGWKMGSWEFEGVVYGA